MAPSVSEVGAKLRRTYEDLEYSENCRGWPIKRRSNQRGFDVVRDPMLNYRLLAPQRARLCKRS